MQRAGQSSLARRALELVCAYGEKSFSKHLGVTAERFVKASEKDGVEFKCTVGTGVCMPEAMVAREVRQPQLGIGAVMALFDEVASHALVVQDHSRRSGVSVCLHAHQHEDIHAGTDIVIKARAVKNGKVLGFAEAVMEDANTGRLLATSQLIKHLPLGVAYDVMMGPVMLPYTIALADTLNRHPAAAKLIGRWITPSRTSPIDPRMHPEINAYDAINLQGSHVLVHQDISNPLGYLHGGAVAMAAESKLVQQLPDTALRVRRMKVEYMTALKRRAHFELDGSNDQTRHNSQNSEHFVRINTFDDRAAAVATLS